MKAKTSEKTAAKANTKANTKAVKGKKGEKVYAVDVHWDMAKSFEVKAKSREDAIRKIETAIRNGEVGVLKSGFEAMECWDVNCVGEENDKGEIEFD